jgi:hypothetical protein
MLLSGLAKAIRVARYFPDPFISYSNLHKISNRATPKIMFSKYNLPFYFSRLSMEKFQKEIGIHLTLTKLIRNIKINLEL